VFFRVPDWATELRERERLFIDIVRLADKLGVQFAFPTRTIHMYREEHGPAQRRHPVPGADDERDARAAGSKAAREVTRGQPWRTQPPPAVDFDDFAARSRDLGGDE
jgi:MscS family membrane protein